MFRQFKEVGPTQDVRYVGLEHHKSKAHVEEVKQKFKQGELKRDSNIFLLTP